MASTDNESHRRIIGIDIDDVLISTHSKPLNDFYNAKFGTSWKKEDYHSHNLEEVWGGTREEAVDIVNEYLNSQEHDKSPAIEYAKEAITQLAKHNSLVLVTARNQDMEEKTLTILNTHFIGIFNKIYFTNQFVKDSKAEKRSKSSVCKELGVEIFIDDALHNAEDIASVGIPVLLFDQPWNQTDTLPPLITRVHSWKEILKKLS